MNRDDIIRMAREASGGTIWWPLYDDTLERFAALVVAADAPGMLEAMEEFVNDYENGDMGEIRHYARRMRAIIAKAKGTA